jgi:hypothetical protein
MANNHNKPIIRPWPRLLSIDDAAEFIGLSPGTLRNRLCRRAADPFPVRPKRQGRRVVFDIKDLEKYADELPYSDEANG